MKHLDKIFGNWVRLVHTRREHRDLVMRRPGPKLNTFLSDLLHLMMLVS